MVHRFSPPLTTAEFIAGAAAFTVRDRTEREETMVDQEWTPPFAATGIEDLACPECHAEGHVHVREQGSYVDGNRVDAYCGGCHARLTVAASVDIAFGDAESEPPKPAAS